MSDDNLELKRIAWADVFPFVRLFRTCSRTISFGSLGLAFAAIVLSYSAGRLLDQVWISAGAGTKVLEGMTEVHAFGGGKQALRMWDQLSANAPTDTKVRGPYGALLEYESHCFAAAIHGAVRGDWGLSSSGSSSRPEMLSSVAAGAKGLLWVATKRPWYTLLCGLIHLLVFSFFGGAICRIAAVRITRDEGLPVGQALSFVREKWADLLAAPLLPVAIFVVAGTVMMAGGVLGAIPYVGAILVGLTYGLALLGGVFLVASSIALVFGFHLMWPTIAVEGSDSFDGVQRSASYLVQRPWSLGFYSFVLLLYGAVTFIVIRGMAMLLLKMTHTATGWGINFFGWAHSSGDAGLGKLHGMWAMPAWADLPLLPSIDDKQFWGGFHEASGPLSGTETFGQWLLMIWVFLVVSLVAAYVVSFYFYGSTQMYLLLRREVDGVEHDEIFYEEFDEEEFPEDSDEKDDGGKDTGGESLPVANSPSS